MLYLSLIGIVVVLYFFSRTTSQKALEQMVDNEIRYRAYRGRK